MQSKRRLVSLRITSINPNERELWTMRSGSRVFPMVSSTPACPISGKALLEIASLEPELEKMLFEEIFLNESGMLYRQNRL